MLKNNNYQDRMMTPGRGTEAVKNADPSCPRCNGTGRLGWYDIRHTEPVPCTRCARKAPKKDTPSEP